MTTTEIEWGVLLTLPNGTPNVEAKTCRSAAFIAADNVNHSLANGGAKVVYREVRYGDWVAGEIPFGDVQWGVRETWHDGHVEVRDQKTRHLAELDSRGGAHHPSTREVVARLVQAGDWWLAEVTA